MTDTKYDVVGVGNAIVDVLAHASEEFLKEEGIERGGMTLIDEARAGALYNKMHDATYVSGGSAANTIAGFGSFGGDAAFIGRVANDKLGDIFRHDMQMQGIDTHVPSSEDGLSTASCYIFITTDENGDTERSMNTFLGASTEFAEQDVDEATIAAAKVTYLEGYLFDKDEAKAAFRKAASFAKKHDRKVALTLSDFFCVDRHREEFLDLIENGVDILFANKKEILALFETEDLEEAFAKVKEICPTTVVTLSSKGAQIITEDEQLHVPAEKIDSVVDVTGAGDQFAAGFLYGYTQDMPLKECGRLACAAAATIIQVVGPRPQKPFSELLTQDNQATPAKTVKPRPLTA